MPADEELRSGPPRRVPVEWDRCEPVEGVLDEEAFGRYAAVLDGCDARGVLPVVVLHHRRHPAWLGDDFWLRLEAPARFGAWAAAVAARLGGSCRHWITVEGPNAVAVGGWLSGRSAPGRTLAVGDLVRALDHLLAAHVEAHGALHRHRPDALVTTTVAPSPLYELGPLLTDGLLARAEGVGRDELHDWLGARRRAWYGCRSRPTAVEAALRRMARSAVPLERALPRTLDAVWRAPHVRPLDDLAVELGGSDGAVGDGPPAGRAHHPPFRATVGRAIEAAVLAGEGRR